jgi:hypothetical protein
MFITWKFVYQVSGVSLLDSRKKELQIGRCSPAAVRGAWKMSLPDRSEVEQTDRSRSEEGAPRQFRTSSQEGFMKLPVLSCSHVIVICHDCRQCE